jgi:hypothetical protein
MAAETKGNRTNCKNSLSGSGWFETPLYSPASLYEKLTVVDLNSLV